jgi:RNA polymerase sigma-70 factor (ECF subfamily)
MSAMVESASVRDMPVRLEGPRPAGFLGGVSLLVHAHRERLLSYARRHGLDAEEALDVVQDSFISFLELPEARTIAHESEDSLKFLTVIVRHKVQNQRRKRVRRGRVHSALGVETVAGEVQSSEALIAHAEELSRVSGCLLRMAQLERDVVRLSLLDEQPRDRVAEALGISQGYLRVLLHRAREHLRSCPFEYEAPAAALSFESRLE